MTNTHDAFFAGMQKTAGLWSKAVRGVFGKTSRLGARTTKPGGRPVVNEMERLTARGPAELPVNKSGRGFANPNLRKAMADSGGKRVWADNTRKMRTLGRAGLIGAGAAGTAYLAHKMFSKPDSDQ